MKTKVVIQTNFGSNTTKKSNKKRKLDENKDDNLNGDDRKPSIDDQIITTINKPYYKCTRCDIKYDTQIELKAHYYDEHIDNEHKPLDLCTEPIVDEKQVDDESSSTTCTTPNDTNLDEKQENGEETSRKKRKLEKKEATNKTVAAEKSQKIDNTKKKSEQNDVDFSAMSDEEIIEFNLDRIDEKELIENISKQKYDKRNDLLAGRVGWAQWRKTMWPAIIEKVIANKTVLTVFIRYYEGERLGKKFKLDSSKVELFYKCKEHTKYKVLAALDKPGRKKFFIAYTNALNDYIKYNLNEDKAKQEQKNNNNDSLTSTIDGKKESSNNSSKPTKQKYFILGKPMTIDEVRTCANEEYSEEQLNENKRRVECSNKLIDLIMTSSELKDHLIGIMKSEVDCQRHRDYLKMNARDRRKSVVISLGPLIEDDQLKLGTYLRELCDSNYEEKPTHLDKYYFDVLYPEAVIWGLKKIHSISYKEADKKFKQGFKQTNEEVKKRKCKEIVSRLSLSNGQNENNETNNNNNNAHDDSNSFVDPQFNEDDTSFFAYQQQTDENLEPLSSVCKEDTSDKRLSDSLPQLVS